MKKVKVFCDSCSSFTKKDLEQLKIECIPLSFEIDGKHYTEFDGVEDYSTYFDTLKKSKKVSTGAVNTETYLDAFTPFLEKGYKILYISLSSGFSSCFANARTAKVELEQKYGEKTVFVIDSFTGSYGSAIKVLLAMDYLEQGMELDKIVEKLTENGSNIKSYFIPQDLGFLSRGGRINWIVAGIGALLNVGVLTTQIDGKLKVVGKNFGFNKTFNMLKERIKNEIIDNPKKVFVGHTNNLENAEKLKSFILENNLAKDVEIGFIDHTMSCHCGPGTIAVFFEGKE